MAYSDIKDPSAYFYTLIFTGGGTFNDQHINDAHSGDFQPDLIWAKDRVNAYNHDLVDSSRGPTVAFHPNTTDAEYTRTQSNYDFTSFDSNGFTTGGPDFTNSFGGNTNPNGKVAWQWKANAGTTSSNTDGSITSTVQANQDAGFSIITYTGTGGGETFGHGLGVAPDMWIVKRRSGTGSWAVGFNDANILGGTSKYLILQSAAATSTYNNFWGSSPASSTVMRIAGDTTIGGSGSTYVAYAFAEKQGFSKFGKYVGNGSGTSDGTFDGTFVYTGFSPSFLMIKRSDGGAEDWNMFDNKRQTYNYNQKKLYANQSAAESGNVYDAVDFLSNGFKIRTGRGGTNTSGGTYMYMAFAENPFVAGGIPTTAR